MNQSVPRRMKFFMGTIPGHYDPELKKRKYMQGTNPKFLEISLRMDQ